MDKRSLLDDYLSEKQLAEELSVSVRTVKRWRRLNQGPPFVKVGRRLYASREAVRKWLAEGGGE